NTTLPLWMYVTTSSWPRSSRDALRDGIGIIVRPPTLTPRRSATSAVIGRAWHSARRRDNRSREHPGRRPRAEPCVLRGRAPAPRLRGGLRRRRLGGPRGERPGADRAPARPVAEPLDARRVRGRE